MGVARRRVPVGRAATKREVRIRVLRQLRTQKEGERRRKSEAIRRKLVRLAAFRKAKTVLCYVSLLYEVETRRLIEQMLDAGKRVVVPRVVRRQLLLSELRDPDEDLSPGAFGVLEPRPQAHRPVRPEELDLAIVPGLAFDRRGHRLGHGWGYFDRLLARVPRVTPTVGVCFSFQLVDRLPTGPHDRPVHRVLFA